MRHACIDRAPHSSYHIFVGSLLCKVPTVITPDLSVLHESSLLWGMTVVESWFMLYFSCISTEPGCSHAEQLLNCFSEFQEKCFWQLSLTNKKAMRASEFSVFETSTALSACVQTSTYSFKSRLKVVLKCKTLAQELFSLIVFALYAFRKQSAETEVRNACFHKHLWLFWLLSRTQELLSDLKPIWIPNLSIFYLSVFCSLSKNAENQTTP